MDNFSHFLKITEAVKKHGIVCEGIFDLLPDIGLPTMTKTARIDHVMDKKNPIFIGLSDGTKLYMTYDEFRRIEGKPERGKNMLVVMQRHGKDATDYPSVITKCVVH